MKGGGGNTPRRMLRVRRQHRTGRNEHGSIVDALDADEPPATSLSRWTDFVIWTGQV